MRLLMVSGDRLLAAGKKGPFHNLQMELARHFERIDVIAPRPDGDVVQTEWFDGRLHLHPARGGRLGMLAYVKRKGRELLAQHHHDLTVSHDYGWFYNGLGCAWLARKTGVPYVSEIHHVPGFPVAADLREVFDRFVAKRYVRWARKRACRFRVVNHGQLQPLLIGWGVPEEKIAVLGSLYIDTETFAPPAVPVQPMQDVTYVGRMVNNKGLDRIIDALGDLVARGRDISALLVGSGPLQEATEERARRRNIEERVQFVNWVGEASELANVYRRSRVVVCASTCEGNPRFTVEAMACGTPVVSTQVGTMVDLLADGRAGRLVDFSIVGLANGIEEVLADEERRLGMGRAAREIAERFERTAMIRAYAEGLQRIAEEENGKR
ncbi:MAG: glycosyltransferase family 4 protein [Planctomycetota bacterium]|nr:glycosyltransferase family 4 protein [Planctomycetota bacterium]